MPLQKRLGVFGILPYVSGTNASTPFEDAGLRWLFDESAPGSLTSYWRDVTGGEVDISATEVFGWFVVEDAGLVNAVKGPERSACAQAAANYVQSLGIDMTSFDGLVFFIGGQIVGAGATGVYVGPFFNQLKPTALLDDNGEHSFMAHEIGHVIGQDHSFRPNWQNPTAGLFYGEYGDAYDIMSAQTYGGRPVQFALGHDPKSGINPTAKLWTAAGPGVSPATTWRYRPDFPAPPTVGQIASAAGSNDACHSSAAGSKQGPTLIAMPFENGGGYYTVEYRSSIAWDRALSLNNEDVSYAPGLVVHQIRDLGMPSDGPTWPRLQRITYEATIPLPSAGDNDWSNGKFSVRVTSLESNDSSVSVLIGEALPGTIEVRPHSTVAAGAETRSPGGPVELILVGPSCGTRTYETEFVNTTQFVNVSASSTGFNDPQFTFTVNGAAMGNWSTIGSKPQTGFVSFDADVAVPTGWHLAETRRLTISASYSVKGNAMTLRLPGGHGRYNVFIGVMATERNNSIAQASVIDTLDITTQMIDIPQAAKDAEDECRDFLVNKGLQGHRPDEIDPLGPIAVIPEGDWSRLQGKELADAVIGLERLQTTNPRLARELETQASAQLGVHTEQLRGLANQLNRVQR